MVPLRAYPFKKMFDVQSFLPKNSDQKVCCPTVFFNLPKRLIHDHSYAFANIFFHNPLYGFTKMIIL